MLRYAMLRVMLAVPSLLGLTAVVFFAIRVLMPTDIVDLAMGDVKGNDLELERQMRKEFGFDGPLVMQYLRWLGGALQGDLGTSFLNGRSVTSELLYRVPTSVELGLGALSITVIIAVPLGLMSAVRRDSAVDYLARGSAILFYAVPGFWVAILVLVFGSVLFSWAPPLEYRSLWTDPVANLSHIALPMVILGLHSIGTMTRLVRTQVLEVIQQDYVRTARAKGLNTRALYARHVLRNALLPIVTDIGLQVPAVVAGTVIFEQLFVIPGVGRYLLDSLQKLDIYVVLGANLFFGSLLILSNLIVDILYGVIDPRIRLAQ